MNDRLRQATELLELMRSSTSLPALDLRAIQAHDLAASLWASGESTAALDLATALLVKSESHDARCGCELILAKCEIDLGRFVAAAQRLQMLMGNLVDCSAPTQDALQFSCENNLAYAEFKLGRIAESKRRLEGVRARLLNRPDGRDLGWSACNLGNVLLHEGNIRGAQRLYHEALVSGVRSGCIELQATALRNLGITYRQQCRWEMALEVLEESLETWRRLQHKANSCFVEQAKAIVLWKKGKLGEAIQATSSCKASAMATGLEEAAIWAAQLEGLIHTHAGEFDKSIAALQASASMNGNPDYARPSLLIIEYLGDVHLEQGQAAEALKHYDEVWPKALALVPKGDVVAELRRRRAECYLLLGRQEDAYQASREALEHCRELGDRYEEAATYRVLALSAAAVGKPDEARRHFTQGFAYYDDIETPYEWGKLWMSYGDWLSGKDAAHHADKVAAREAYVAAREHFGHMGARAKLREAEQRLARLDESTPPAGAAAPSASPPAGTAGTARPIARSAKRRPAAQLRLDARAEWAWNAFYMVTRHEPLINLLERATKLANSGTPILIMGETGTGKELIAAGIHRHSKVTGHYISLNCAAVPRDMIESEMFGHARGAFSGAVVERLGMVEAASGGTLFLDEVGEMSEAMQAKLLRFLESGEYRRVGESLNRHVSTRMVAATNMPRERLSRGDEFRRDLYWRLAHGVLEVPALRHRPGDVTLLVDHFLRLESKKMGKPDLALSEAARAALESYGWPGNIRELVGVVRRGVALAENTIEVDDLELGSTHEVAVTLTEELAATERARIENAMRENDNSPTSAARALGIPRTTLIMKLKRLGIRDRFSPARNKSE